MKFKKLVTSLLLCTMTLGAVGCSNKSKENVSGIEGTTLKVVSAYGGIITRRIYNESSTS